MKLSNVKISLRISSYSASKFDFQAFPSTEQSNNIYYSYWQVDNFFASCQTGGEKSKTWGVTAPHAPPLDTSHNPVNPL